MVFDSQARRMVQKYVIFQVSNHGLGASCTTSDCYLTKIYKYASWKLQKSLR